MVMDLRAVRDMLGGFDTPLNCLLTPKASTVDELAGLCHRPLTHIFSMAPNYGLFYGVEITTLCVAIICFTLRLSNRYVKKISTFDDVVLAIATCFSISMTAMVWRLYELGYALDLEDVPVKNEYPIGRLSLALFSMFPMCYSLIRISILFTYLKLFPSQTNRWLCWGLCGLQLAYALWAGLTTLLQCRPINAYWNKTIENTFCNSPRNQDYAILALNSSFDIIVYIWPAHYLYKLKLPFRSRLELILAFSIGLVNLGLSFARLSLLITMYSTRGWMRYGPPGVLIIIVESHVGITCASLPYLRFLFEFVSSNYLSKSGYGATKEPTKVKHTDPGNENHPFVELQGRSGGGIQRKTDIEVSTFREESIEEDLEVYDGRNRMMEDQMRRDERAWSGEDILLPEKPREHPDVSKM